MIDFNKIIEKYKTPLFVFDIDSLKKRVNYLRSKLNYNMVYAVKANTFVIKEIDSSVDRFEICSPGEFNICEKLNINHNKMVISGVNKDEYFIEKLISNYDDILKYTIESYNQFELLKGLALKYKRKIHVLVRLTSGNQFGVSDIDLFNIIKNNNNEYVIIDGLEFFPGTQKHSLKILEKEYLKVKSVIDEIKEKFGIEFSEVEIGPGLPVFYFQGEEFDEDSYLEELNKIIGIFDKYVVSLEIGRSMVASSGYYLTSVVDLKENQNGKFAILDGGINHLVYYGQTMAMKVPYYELISKEKSDEQVYNLCGSLCTTNDYLVKNIKLNRLSIGDTFIFKNAGAYSTTEGIALFLSRDLPKIVLIKKNESILVRDNFESSIINCPNYKEEIWKN